MPISSMTGFARRQGGDARYAWTWEARSVNGRGREVRCRLANGLERIEPVVRERTSQAFQRGNISLTLSLTRQGREGAVVLNRELLDQVLAMLPELRSRIPDAAPPRLDGILALRGVLEAVEETPSEEQEDALAAAVLADLDLVLAALAENRAAEGARLAEVVLGLVTTIADLTAQARTLAVAQPQAMAERLRQQLAEILEATPSLTEERLLQEVALLAVKADVREELDRLDAHVAAARELLAAPGGVGRKLDFLCQEFNREANTLCSKSADVPLTRIGLDLKATVDQLREQVQNIE